MRRAAVFAALLLAVLAGALRGYWPLGGGSVSSAGGLTCSVRASSCVGGEVAVFRMSALANAHAGTVTGSSYGDVVCCSGPAGLSTNCSGNYATVLRLSATTNAHVASSDVSYGTQACLSATGTTISCQYASSCGSGYTCLATISGSTNAHVADCSSGGYQTKVCCAAGAAPAVGGIAELPDATRSAGGSSSPPYAALAGAAGAAVLLLMAGGWYARRRWLT